MTKLQAIAHLELSFAHNHEFKKHWVDYLEMSILESIDEITKTTLTSEQKSMIAKRSTENILITLFAADWWEAQGLK